MAKTDTPLKERGLRKGRESKMERHEQLMIECLKWLSEEMPGAHAFLVKGHLSIAASLRAPGIRDLALNIDEGLGIDPDDLARYVRMGESKLVDRAAEHALALLLPTDLESLELLSKLGPEQLDALAHKQTLNRMSRAEIEQAVREILEVPNRKAKRSGHENGGSQRLSGATQRSTADTADDLLSTIWNEPADEKGPQ
jgi:hypothetical protein